MNKHTHVYTHFYFLSLPLSLSHTFTEAAKEICNDNKKKTHASSHIHTFSQTLTHVTGKQFVPYILKIIIRHGGQVSLGP